jgi:hypothetical protein
MDTSKFLRFSGDTDWARGCEHCRFGLTVTPRHRTGEPLYVERAIQAALGLIQFCECRAGHAYRAFLRTKYREIRDDPSYNLKALQDKIAGESDAPPMRYVTPEEMRQESLIDREREYV